MLYFYVFVIVSLHRKYKGDADGGEQFVFFCRYQLFFVDISLRLYVMYERRLNFLLDCYVDFVVIQREALAFVSVPSVGDNSER